MGLLLGKTMDDNLKKQQEFRLKTQQLELERQIAMQNELRERQLALTIARSRDFFWYWITFDTLVSTGLIIGAYRNKKWNLLVPLVPLSFMAVYHWDNAYGPKLKRIRGMADQIMDKEHSLLDLPHGLPTFSSVESARLEYKKTESLKSGNDVFL
uniref:Plasminogen receptor (KT) n=1 Tax=Arion vulgaris TaxID=1028688 RepID=A0A0B6YI80_9EUPU